MKKLLISLVAVAIFCVVFPFLYVEWQIYDLNHLSPTSDLRINIIRNDYRFAAMSGVNVEVPLLPGGQYNSLVKLHGVRLVYNLGDFIIWGRQEVLRLRARSFCAQYNKLLVDYLHNKPDKITISLINRINKEMFYMETHSAAIDSVIESKKSKPAFIWVSDESTAGIPDNVDDVFLGNMNLRILEVTEVILSPKQRKRFQLILRDYIIPYNNNLYNIMKKNKLRGKA